jgi:DNA-binding transcriptional LysR family regulator
MCVPVRSDIDCNLYDGAALELRHLRAFVAIADTGHYGRAAASLKLTQPAITQRIQVLERELGVQLFTRNAREVHLTPAGEALIEHARSLVQIEDRALEALRDHLAGIAGRLRISYLTLWDRGLPADIVAEYRRRYPTVKLDMTTGYSQSNMDRLVSGEIDFAFIGPAVAPRAGVVMRSLDRHEVVVVIPPTHRFMQMERVPIESIRGESIVAATPGINPNLNAVSLDWLEKYTGEPPNIIRQEPPDQAGAALAQSGNAIAFMTEHRAVIARTEGLEYRPLTPALVVEFGLAYARDNPSPALANLIATVDEIAPALSPELPDGSELLARQVGPPGVIKNGPG